MSLPATIAEIRAGIGMMRTIGRAKIPLDLGVVESLIEAAERGPAVAPASASAADRAAATATREVRS